MYICIKMYLTHCLDSYFVSIIFYWVGQKVHSGFSIPSYKLAVTNNSMTNGQSSKLQKCQFYKNIKTLGLKFKVQNAPERDG